MSVPTKLLLYLNFRPAVLFLDTCLRAVDFQARRSTQLRMCCRHIINDSGATRPMSGTSASPWQQEFYKYFLPIQTRIGDTDWFGHVNNIVYYSFFDTVINEYLIRRCGGLGQPKKTVGEPSIVGFMVNTQCTFKEPLSYPEVLLAGMAVTKLGNSSVTYTVGIFAENKNKSELTKSLSVDAVLLKDEKACFNGYNQIASAVGQCVHVFVDLNGDQKPVRIPDVGRISLRNILVPYEGQISKL